MTELPPFLPFYLGALLALVTRGSVRNALLVATPLVSAALLMAAPEDQVLRLHFLGFELAPYRVDGLSLIFGYAFNIAALLAIVFSLHLRDTVQIVAGLAYAGSAVGAVFAGDLLSLFTFWELLAVTSVPLIWARRTRSAYLAGMRYLVIQVCSGLLLLAGALFHLRGTGGLQFGFIGLEGPAGYLLFLAFGIKCAFPLLHNWVTDAYTEATPTGTVFLSAFTTKVAVYALARGFPGTEALIYIGVTMACFPIFYAVIENDLRRVLAYSLINQVGFMVVGIGIGTPLALNGAVSHAFNDVIFKGLLFMSMGAVLWMTGRSLASELGGLYKTMPRTALLCIVGAASISAFPLFSGFVSKSMVMSASLETGHGVVWLLLLFASAGVFHHAGIKIPYFAFFAHDSGLRPGEPPGNMLLAMGLAAALCIAIGCWPAGLYSLLPFDTGYDPYDATHVLAQTQLLLFSALAFVWLNLRGLYPPELPSVNLDADWFYRRCLPAVIDRGSGRMRRWDARLRRWSVHWLKGLAARLSWLPRDGSMPASHHSGNMVLGVALLLALYLMLSFIQIGG